MMLSHPEADCRTSARAGTVGLRAKGEFAIQTVRFRRLSICRDGGIKVNPNSEASVGMRIPAHCISP